MKQYGRGLWFTLIELLVVISIVALLASILLPALRKSWETARKVKCAGNLKQCYLGFIAYADDYAGYLPSPKDHLGSSEWRWRYKISPYLNAEGKENIANSKTVFECPSTPTNQVHSYGINNRIAQGFATDYEYTAPKLSAFKYPAKRLLLADENEIMTIIASYGTDSCTIGVEYRHNNRANFLFVDGSARDYHFTLLPKYGDYDSWTYYYTGTK